MPNYLWHRWYGIDGRYYRKLWSKLDGDNDEYLFDDFCDTTFDVKNNNFEWMIKLSRKRMHKLYLFSVGMLSNYLIITARMKVIEFIIGVAYKLTGYFRHREDTLS
jgi:hypothetical protein